MSAEFYKYQQTGASLVSILWISYHLNNALNHIWPTSSYFTGTKTQYEYFAGPHLDDLISTFILITSEISNLINSLVKQFTKPPLLKYLSSRQQTGLSCDLGAKPNGEITTFRLHLMHSLRHSWLIHRLISPAILQFFLLSVSLFVTGDSITGRLNECLGTLN